MTWEPQIRHLLAKAQPRLNLLRIMSSFNCTHDGNMLLHLYKAIVRPIFEYSAVAHISAAECHQMKLQQLQNAAIRCILKIPKYISSEILHDASGLSNLHDHSVSFASHRVKTMVKTSPIVQDTLDQFQLVQNKMAHKSPIEFINQFLLDVN